MIEKKGNSLLKKVSVFLIVFFFWPFLFPAHACLGPADFYSVIVPSDLQMFGATPHHFYVGDILLLKKEISLKEGKAFLKAFSPRGGLPGLSGRYYLLSGLGKVSLQQKIQGKIHDLSFHIEQPPRRRGSCSDFRK